MIACRETFVLSAGRTPDDLVMAAKAKTELTRVEKAGVTRRNPLPGSSVPGRPRAPSSARSSSRGR